MADTPRGIVADQARRAVEIAGLLDAQVARQPDRPALEFEGRPWSCRELNQRINRLAQALRAACEGQIARCKLPKAVRFIGLDEFPRSTTGNVKRRELEARLDIITLTGATS